MSKNIYRVNKKSDLDEIMKNNFLKPIFITFVSKSIDKKLYNDIAVTLKTLSKEITYGVILIIDFDDFIDNLNFFSSIKDNCPHFIAYFKGKQISSCDDKNNFIPVITNLIDNIHTSYINKLIDAFNNVKNNSKDQINTDENNTENNNEENNNEENNNEEDNDNVTEDKDNSEIEKKKKKLMELKKLKESLENNK